MHSTNLHFTYLLTYLLTGTGTVLTHQYNSMYCITHIWGLVDLSGGGCRGNWLAASCSCSTILAMFGDEWERARPPPLLPLDLSGALYDDDEPGLTSSAPAINITLHINQSIYHTASTKHVPLSAKYLLVISHLHCAYQVSLSILMACCPSGTGLDGTRMSSFWI